MKVNKIDLELIVLGKDDALDAQKMGATRVELVRELDKGGLTPTINVINDVSNSLKIPVYVMLREKASSFIYSAEEFSLLLEELKAIKKTNAKGIVFGSLNNDFTINEEQLKIIIKEKEHLELTFHRAIDATSSYKDAINVLKKYPQIDFVLSSGGGKTAVEGFYNLSFASTLIFDKLLIGSGVGIENILPLSQLKHIHRFHIGTSVRNNNDIKDKISPIKMDTLLKLLV